MKRPYPAYPLWLCLLLPVGLLLIGLAGAAVVGMKTIPEARRDDIRAVVPPSLKTALARPGRYDLWIYEKGFHEGAEYVPNPVLPPGSKIHVLDRRSGQFLPWSTLWAGSAKSMGGERAVLYGGFETIQDGQEVEIIFQGLSQATVIGLSTRRVTDFYWAMLAIASIVLVTLMVSLTALIVLLHRRKQLILKNAADHRGDDE